MSGTMNDNIRFLFYPKTVAVFGVTDTPDRVGYNILAAILEGGYTGKVYPIHPRHQEIQGRKVYRSLEEIPEPIDLAVITLNERFTVETAELCGRAGVKALLCNAGGFRETDEKGNELEKTLISIAQKYQMAVLGPNTLGLVNTNGNLYSIFYPINVPTSNISIICQSGGVGLSTIQTTVDEGIGINKFIGVGNCTVLDIPDYLDYLATDDSTDVIGVYLEGAADAAKLIRTASRVAQKKPVVVFKAGRLSAASNYTLTHTGAMAGTYQLYEDIFHQHGLFTVDNVGEFVAAMKALSLLPLPEGNRVGVLTHTAGPMVTALDYILSHDCSLPVLADETIAKVKQVLGSDNPPVVLKNPLDAVGLGFSRPIFSGLAEVILQDDNVDLLITCYVKHKTWELPAEEMVEIAQRLKKPMMVNLIGNIQACRPDQMVMHGGGVPLYTTPEKIAVGVAALVHYGKQRKGGANFDHK